MRFTYFPACFLTPAQSFTSFSPVRLMCNSVFHSCKLRHWVSCIWVKKWDFYHSQTRVVSETEAEVTSTAEATPLAGLSPSGCQKQPAHTRLRQFASYLRTAWARAFFKKSVKASQKALNHPWDGAIMPNSFAVSSQHQKTSSLLWFRGMSQTYLQTLLVQHCCLSRNANPGSAVSHARNI